MNYLLERVDQKLAEFPVLKTHANDRLLFDVDLFLRSAASYVQLVPTAETTSSDEVGFAIKNAATDAVLFELRTRSGTWHCGTDGKLTDTKIPAAFDAWNHLQLALDFTDGRCQVLLQVIGEAPSILDQTKLSPSFAAGIPFKIELICDRKQARDDGPAFDNLQLTRVAPQESREGNR